MPAHVSTPDTDHVAPSDALSQNNLASPLLPAGLRRLDRRDFFRLAGSALLLAALPGCGGTSGDSSTSGGNSTGTGPTTGTVPTVSAAGTLNTAQLGGSGLTVGSTYQQSATPDAGGKFTTTVSAQGAQLLTVTDGAGQTRGLGVSVPGSPLTLDATSTALTLLYMTPGLVSIDLKEAASRLTVLQALPSFAALTAFLAKNLPTTSLSALATGGQLEPLKQACLNDYLAGKPAAVRRPQQQTSGTPDDLRGGVTVSAGTKGKDGTPLNLSNIDWRYVNVYRQSLGTIGDELAPYQEANLQGTANPTLDRGLLGGANALSVGALFNQGVSLIDSSYGSAGSATETLDLTQPGGLAQVRYWIIGPGLASVQNELPASMPESKLSTFSYGLTFFYYVFLPLADFAIGSAVSLAKGTLLMGILWEQISKPINLLNLTLAWQSHSASNVSQAMVNAAAALAPLAAAILKGLGLVGAQLELAAPILATAAVAFGAANMTLFMTDMAYVPRLSQVTFQVQAASAYTVTDIGALLPASTSASGANAINNKGQVVCEAVVAYLYDAGTITDIGALLNRTDRVAATAINNSGQVVGETVSGTNYAPFLYSGGKVTVLNFVGSPTTNVVPTINDSGLIGGNTPDTKTGQPQGFLYSNGVMTRLIRPDGNLFVLVGLNNSGQVLGYYSTASGTRQACLYSKGQFTDLNFPGVVPIAMNDSGQIIYQGSQGGAFLYTNGVSTPLVFPGATNVSPTAINASGQVVGQWQIATGSATENGAFIYSNGKMTDLTPLSSASLNYVTGINDAGQICGSAKVNSSQGVQGHAIVLTPK